MKPLFRFAMLALVLVVVALVSALTAMRFAIHGQEVEVPTVIGLSPSDAERSVAGLGLEIQVERQYYSPTIPEGRIMTQMPLPGTKVRRGLEVGSTAEIQLPGTPADRVLAQSPPANASQVSAPQTNLLVTVAADAPAFVAPNFVGQPLGSVSRTLQDAGFRLGTVSMAPPQSNTASNSDTASGAPSISLAPQQPSPASIVVTQWPPAGQKVLAGAVLNFEVR